MNRMPVLVSAMLVGVVIAVVDMFTGWTVKGGAAALVVVLGLLLGAMALFVLMVIAVIRDRRFIVAHSSDARWVLARAARGVRWASLLALGFCVLVFTNCSGGINSGGPTTSGPISDPADFWRLTAAVLGPLLVALLLPLILTSAAAMTVDRRPHTARTLGRLAIWSTVLVGAASLVTVVVGFIFGISACDLATSAGYCAAGAGSVMNGLSLGDLALLLPYLGLVTWALAQIDSRPAT